MTDRLVILDPITARLVLALAESSLARLGPIGMELDRAAVARLRTQLDYLDLSDPALRERRG